MENRTNSIPPELKPLFEANTAHESVRAAISLIRETPPGKQISLLKNSLFQGAVINALAGLDECSREHGMEIVLSVAKQHRGEAHKLIFNETN